eukprot:scaffold196698_cov15-Tisochrysis_lutea.AAC.3
MAPCHAVFLPRAGTFQEEQCSPSPPPPPPPLFSQICATVNAEVTTTHSASAFSRPSFLFLSAVIYGKRLSIKTSFGGFGMICVIRGAFCGRIHGGVPPCRL